VRAAKYMQEGEPWTWLPFHLLDPTALRSYRAAPCPLPLPRLIRPP
jgi:hypothetical protein